MTASSGTSPEIPVVSPLHLLRTKALHAVVVKIVWHCNERVMDELEGEIKAFQAQKFGSKGLARDSGIILRRSIALLEKLRGWNPDLRDYWDPDAELPKVSEEEEMRREKIREQRRDPPLVRRFRDLEVRAFLELCIRSGPKLASGDISAVGYHSLCDGPEMKNF